MSIFVEKSANRKISGSGAIASTYAAIRNTCDKSCPLMDNGCYAQSGNTNLHTMRAEKIVEGFTPIRAARHERILVSKAFKGKDVPQDGKKGGRDLRLHVSGDARTIGAVHEMARIAEDWVNRKGAAVFSYTHAWAKVERRHWGRVSILASVETGPDAEKAKKQGYAPAIVVDTHLNGDKPFSMEGSDTRFIPCPQQTRGVGCTDCRLCMGADRLKESNMGIAFALHGPGTKKGKVALNKKLKVIG